MQVNGQATKVMYSRCNTDGIHVLKFFHNAILQGPIYHYKEATNISFGDSPQLRDPLDKRYVYVKKSTIPNAGEGLFAKRNIPANINFVLYGGLLFNERQMEIRNAQLKKKAEKNKWTLDDPMWHMQSQNDVDLFKSLAYAPFFE